MYAIRSYYALEEVAARRQLDPVVAELLHLVRHLLKREVAMHVGVECDTHVVSSVLLSGPVGG